MPMNVAGRARPPVQEGAGDGRWAALLVFPNLAMFTLFIVIPSSAGSTEPSPPGI